MNKRTRRQATGELRDLNSPPWGIRTTLDRRRRRRDARHKTWLTIARIKWNAGAEPGGSRLRYAQDRLKFVRNLTEENRSFWPINLPGSFRRLKGRTPTLAFVDLTGGKTRDLHGPPTADSPDRRQSRRRVGEAAPSPKTLADGPVDLGRCRRQPGHVGWHRVDNQRLYEPLRLSRRPAFDGPTIALAAA